MTKHADLQSQLDSQRQKIDVDHFDVTVRELARMSAEGELRRAPAYQRKFRWSEGAESRLIESLFLGLPVPAIFVATNSDGTWEVVDGLQRISTLLHFVGEPSAILGTIGKEEPLQLSDLVKLKLFEGLTLAALPSPLQLAFYKRALRVTALSDKSDMNARFDMFERLNTGGVALTPQEVRACIFRGPLSDLLRDLADYPAFRVLVKLQKKKGQDGTREEVVLKFFAYLRNRDAFDGAVTDFLNAYMSAHAQDTDLINWRDLFTRVCDKLAVITQHGPLLRSGVSLTPLNQLEAVMVAAGDLIQRGKRIAAPASDWFDDKELVRASTGATNTRSMLNKRIDRARQLLSGRAAA